MFFDSHFDILIETFRKTAVIQVNFLRLASNLYHLLMWQCASELLEIAVMNKRGRSKSRERTEPIMVGDVVVGVTLTLGLLNWPRRACKSDHSIFPFFCKKKQVV